MKKNRRLNNALVIVIAAVLSLLLHPVVWTRALQRYSNDSLFTLSTSALIGLLLLSALLALGLLWSNIVKTRWLLHRTRRQYRSTALVADLLLITGFYWVVLSLVPQAYYLYYQLVIDGLPWQWVIEPMSAHSFWQIITLSGRASSSLHFSGLVYWCLLLSAALLWLFEPKRPLAKTDLIQ